MDPPAHGLSIHIEIYFRWLSSTFIASLFANKLGLHPEEDVYKFGLQLLGYPICSNLVMLHQILYRPKKMSKIMYIIICVILFLPFFFYFYSRFCPFPTHQVIDLIVWWEEGELVPLLVLNEGLDVHVEGVTGRTLGRLCGQLALRMAIAHCCQVPAIFCGRFIFFWTKKCKTLFRLLRN